MNIYVKPIVKRQRHLNSDDDGDDDETIIQNQIPLESNGKQ